MFHGNVIFTFCEYKQVCKKYIKSNIKFNEQSHPALPNFDEVAKWLSMKITHYTAF